MLDRALANGVSVSAWTFDELYGRDGKFLDALEKRKQMFVGEIPVGFHGWSRQPLILHEGPENTGSGRSKDYPRLAAGYHSSEARNLAKYSPVFRKQSPQRYHIKETDKGPVVWETKWVIARFDRKRKDKKVSNQEWQSETDPDSRITKMKDGRTHLAYKAEHAIDLETGVILAAPVYHADESDANTIGPTVIEAQDNLVAADSQANIKEVLGDKGYHKNETLAELEFTEGLRTYVAEPKQNQPRNWKDKPEEQRQAVTNNRRRIRGDRGRALQRKRSEKVERSFAHVCETGGGRRAWLRGIDKVRKRHLMAAMAHNLGVVMRGLFGIGTARSLQAAGGLADDLRFALFTILRLLTSIFAPTSPNLATSPRPPRIGRKALLERINQLKPTSSTGC